MNLTEFLLARIAEELRDVGFVHNDDCDHNQPPGFPCDCGAPERTRLRCEADRRIVERCGPFLDPFSLTSERACTAEAELAEETLHDLASVYADHPDYRQEWRP